jgi:hypothetical protein
MRPSISLFRRALRLALLSGLAWLDVLALFVDDLALASVLAAFETVLTFDLGLVFFLDKVACDANEGNVQDC